MLSNQRFRDLRATRRRSAGALLVSAAMLGGCSADISRLEAPSYGLAEAPGAPRPAEPIGRRNAGAPLERNQDGWAHSGPRGALPSPAADLPPPAPPSSRVANLPPHVDAAPKGPGAAPFDAAKPKPAATAPAATPAKPAATASGQTIEVQPGDSLFAISKRTGAPISAIMELNGLKSAQLKPGQKLVLPATPGAKRPLAKPGAAAPAVVAAPPPVTSPSAPNAAPAPAVAWTASHTIKPGESLYGIARAHKVSVAELQQQNAITEPTKVRPGLVLRVPGAASIDPAAKAPTTAPAAAVPSSPRVVQTQGGPVAAPKIINAAPVKTDQVAALGGTATDAPAVAQPVDPPAPQSTVPAGKPAVGAKFRWPLKGSLIAGFGKRPDGTHNDGVDIAVPAGTDVHAADGGTVAYAGNELKGFGNLVLIRHDNGWVSAYAHADALMVKRGDTVKRGQVIAKSGQTGTVDQPKLHFELRQGSKPVDPMPHLDKL
jgi:murein DD-endopeptidase MepM/ murein hydrolase activator NlpD